LWRGIPAQFLPQNVCRRISYSYLKSQNYIPYESIAWCRKTKGVGGNHPPFGSPRVNTDRKSTTRFPMSLRWSSYVAPNHGRFPSKIARRLKKVCYEDFLCENRQRQCCKAFISLTIRAKIIGGGDPFYLKFWVKLTALERNRRFSIYFRS